MKEVLAAGALISFASVVIHSVLLVAYRRPDISAGRLLFSGHLYFREDTFTEDGRPTWNRFGYSLFGVLVFGILFLAWVAITGNA